jgi:hypothetical protein
MSAQQQVRSSASRQKSFDQMVEKLSPKDRQNVEKHLTAFNDAGQKTQADLWKRLVGAMSELAPVPPKTTAQRTVQFYVPDGKWRLQVFALEDRKDGTLAAYTEDVLADAVKAGVVTKQKKPAGSSSGLGAPAAGGASEYAVTGAEKPLLVEQLDNKSEADPAPFYKDMLGWNRRALRIIVPADAPEALARAVERICEMAAMRRNKPSA